jgi:lysozyme
MLDLLKLADQLIHHEGMECFPYTDTVGKVTIGVGRNLTDRGLTKEECRHLLANDIEISVGELKMNFHWFAKLDDTRQAALVDLHFNLGINRLKTFTKTLRLIEKCILGDDLWSKVAEELLDSKWAGQVGQRAQTLARMLELGDNPSNPNNKRSL